jgi:DNA-binding protein YbaB
MTSRRERMTSRREGLALPRTDLAAMRRRSSLLTRRLRALDQELAECRLRVGSDNHQVIATVDGNGTLVDIEITDAAVRASHPQRIAPAVVAAVAAARAEAAQVAESRTREVVASVAEPRHQPATDQPDVSRFDGTTWGAP